MTTRTITITVSGAVCALFLICSSVRAQNLFAGSYGNETIVEISGGTNTIFASRLNYPFGLAFNSAGDLFEADQFSGNIYEFAGGWEWAPTTFASGLNNPTGLAFNKSGDLFVSVGGNNSLIEYAPDGGTPTLITTNLYTPSALAFDRAGNLYIANQANDAAGQGYITKITPGGVQTIFAAGLNTPDALAFNNAGDLFVANGNYADTITEITPGGVQSTFASGLDEPMGLAFNSAGDLFVADGGAYNNPGNITELAPDGTVLNVDTSVSKPISLAFGTPKASESLVLNVSGMMQYQTNKANLKGNTTTKTFDEKNVYTLLSNAVANVAGYLNVGLTPQHLPVDGYIAFKPGGNDQGPENGGGFFYVTNKSGFYFPLSGLDTNGAYYSYMELDSYVFYEQTGTGQDNNLSFGFNEPFGGSATYNLNTAGNGSSTADSSALLYIHDYPYDYDDVFSPNAPFDINDNAIEIRGKMTTSLTIQNYNIKSGSITLTGGGNCIVNDISIYGLVTRATATLR